DVASRLPFHEREERVAVETELEAPGRPEAFEGLHGRNCCWQTRRAAPHEVSATPERTFVVEADPGLLTRRCDCDVVDGPRSVAADRRRAVVRDHGSVPTRGERDGVAIDSVLEADGSGAVSRWCDGERQRGGHPERGKRHRAQPSTLGNVPDSNCDDAFEIARMRFPSARTKIH